MLSRKEKAGIADTSKRACEGSQAGTDTQILKRSARKPSERFMRKAITAKSRVSKSERYRVADLVNKLESKIDTDGVANGDTNWNGYRPGHEQSETG